MSFVGASPASSVTATAWKSQQHTAARWWEGFGVHAQPADAVRDLLRATTPKPSRRGKLRDDGVQPTADLIMQRVHEMVGAAYAESSQGVVASAISHGGVGKGQSGVPRSRHASHTSLRRRPRRIHS